MTSILAAALATVVSSAAIEKRDALPAKFTLQSSTTGLDGLLWNSLMYANSKFATHLSCFYCRDSIIDSYFPLGSAYIGNIKYSVYSEPLSREDS